jgi:hypothetical protein
VPLKNDHAALSCPVLSPTSVMDRPLIEMAASHWALNFKFSCSCNCIC